MSALTAQKDRDGAPRPIRRQSAATTLSVVPDEIFVSAVVATILGAYIFEPTARASMSDAAATSGLRDARLVLAVGLAWPIQELIVRPNAEREGDALGELISYWCIPVAVGTATALMVLLARASTTVSANGAE